MNTFRGSLPGDATRARYDEAMAAAGAALAAARRTRDELYAAGGAQAVAEAAQVPPARPSSIFARLTARPLISAKRMIEDTWRRNLG